MVDPEEYRRLRRNRSARNVGRPETWAALYVSVRKALGFQTCDLRYMLGTLLRFMHARNVVSLGRIDRKLAAAWLHSGSPQQTTIEGRLSAMRGFFRYLVSVGAMNENVWDCFPTPRPERFIPYIFSLSELRTVLDSAHRSIDSPNKGFSRARAACYAMFHTVYACGLRAREVCRLKIGDLDRERSLFVVRDTKFGKSRLVPFNRRTRELVSHYLDRVRPADDGKVPDAPLFLSFWRRVYNPEKFSLRFSRACAAAGVYRPKKTKGNVVYGGTTVHALRHTFAVHRLLKWYEDGADVNAKLPLLATYMGHAHYWYTQKYLAVLPRFIDIARKLFSDGFETPLKDLE